MELGWLNYTERREMRLCVGKERKRKFEFVGARKAKDEENAVSMKEVPARGPAIAASADRWPARRTFVP